MKLSFKRNKRDSRKARYIKNENLHSKRGGHQK